MATIDRRGSKLSPSQISVLIVDDQQFYRNLLTEICKSIGIFKITTAIDGEDALEALSDCMPTFVICDWVMPQMDGIEFTKKVRALRNDKLRMTPIIMATSNNLVSQISVALEAGVDTFALKPVSAKSVFDRIREVIETPRIFVETYNYVGPCRRRNRKSESYKGVFRRYDDPSVLKATAEEEARFKSKLKQEVIKLRNTVTEFQSGHAPNLDKTIEQSKEVLKLAQDSGDEQLSRVCWSLTAYIDKCRAGSKLRIEIITKHLESMDVLISTPLNLESARIELASSLHQVVLRALQAA